MREPADRARIDPFVVMEVVAAAAALDAATGGDVVHLEVGQPGTPAPAVALDAARAAIDAADPLGYTEAAGLPELRVGITRLYRSRYGVDIDPARVIITVGASGACVLAMLAAFANGDRVAVTVPGYPCYRQMLRAFGADVVDVRIAPEDGFRLAPDHLDAAAGAGQLAGLVLASPANPTGTVLDRERLDAIADWCDDHEVWLVADEIYHGITFDTPAPTAASHPSAIVVGSFSKYFSMTGWRLGWMVVPEPLLAAVERLQQNLFLCPPALSQVAALGALSTAATVELDDHVARYRINRDRLIAALRELGIERIAPADGAFYVYADTSAWHPDSRALCVDWLDDLRVAATPGIDFDQRDGHRWVRFSVSGTTEAIDLAIDRLRTWRHGEAATLDP